MLALRLGWRSFTRHKRRSIITATAISLGLAMLIVFKAIDAVIGLRVSRETELRGLDLDEHGMESYSGFQIFTTE